MTQTFDFVHFTPSEEQMRTLSLFFNEETKRIRYHGNDFQIKDGIISIVGLGTLNHSVKITEPLATDCKRITITKTLTGIFWLTVQSS